MTIETRVKAALSRLSNSYESLPIQKHDSENVDISDERRSDFPAWHFRIFNVVTAMACSYTVIMLLKSLFSGAALLVSSVYICRD